ncbi:glycosyltransferase family 32 protein [Deferrisoma camini]|uniref:glycosyltransferase family 32 protein n=1 Tax=Deferrisoma camini TaxID=1035120 RepID=UPI00146C4C89|nr:glycosyltransferase [Deferrisoma camini]
MIPKIIHCCWFGGAQKGEIAMACLDSWRSFLPDYEIVEWNETNFDIESVRYVQEAYRAKKWAFVADYVRLWALYNYGGIYLDTDVRVFRSFDSFLVHNAFTGFEYFAGRLAPVTAVMGAIKGHSWIGELLAEYDGATFLRSFGGMDLKTNTVRITENLINKYGVKNDDTYQVVGDDLHIYPSYYFCRGGDQAYAQHLFDGSWAPWWKRAKGKFLWMLDSLKGARS